MLRRTKTVVFDDEPDQAQSSVETPIRPSLRRNLEALRAASLRSVPAEPEPEPEQGPTATDNPVRQRFDYLNSELERAPITKGSQESLQALRDEFRRRHVSNDDAPGGVGLPFSLGGLKPSRIILLAVALLAGGLAAYLALGRAPEPVPEPVPVVEPVAAPVAPTLEVLVARTTIPAGSRLGADLLEWQKWPEEAVRAEYITSAAAPEAMTAYADSVARSEILAGEPIRAEKLGTAGAGFLSAILASGYRAVSVSIDARSASGGFIVPNDHVDVVLTRMVGPEQVSRTILTNVRVLAINERFGATSEGQAAATPQETMFSNALATLELDIDQAELIINAANAGSLSLLLRPAADSAAVADDAQQAINQSIRVSSPFWLGAPPPEKTAGAEPLFPKMQTLP